MAHAFQDNAFQGNAFQMFYVPITSTTVLQKPVDYALAGDQDEPGRRSLPVRAGRLAGKAMRHVFNE